MTTPPHSANPPRRARWLPALAALVLAAVGHAQSPTGQRRALLIGINRYQSARLTPLRGAVSDARLVAQLLRTRYGFDDIRMLLDEQATRAGMIAALDRLVADTAPGDVVWVHYSGHGGQVEDLNGDEDDRLDETLIPHDGRSGSTLDLVDDELEARLRRLRTEHVVVVFDSCHSGTATRAGGTDVVRRTGPRDRRTDAYRKSPALIAKVQRTPSPFVFFAATLSDEEALDARIDGSANGLFTRALVQALTQAPPTSSPRQVLHAAAQELRRLTALVSRHAGADVDPTTPTLETTAAKCDQPLLLPRAGVPTARVPWVAVQVQGRVMLRGGVELRAVPGSTWALYPPGELAFAPGTAAAVGTVTSRQGTDAVLQLRPELSRTAEVHDFRAILVAPPPPAGSAVVRLEGDAATCQSLTTALRSRVPNLKLATGRQPADFLIRAQPGYCRLHAATGDVIAERAAPDLIARVVSRSILASSLLSLDNPSSAMFVQARVRKQVPERQEVGTRGVRVKATGTGASRHRIWREGEPYSSETCLQLEVESTHDCYLTVVSVDAQGEVWPLFPFSTRDPQTGQWSFGGNPGFLPNGRIPAGQRVLLPDTHSESNAAGFVFCYAEPVGTDTIRVFATAELETAERVRGAVRDIHAAQQTGRSGDSTTEAQRGLLELRSWLTAVSTRGFVVGKEAQPVRPAAGTASGDWTAVSVTVQVEAQ